MSRLPALTLALVLAATPAFAQEPAPTLSNPQMSVILDGIAYTDDAGGAGNAWLGEAAGIVHAHEEEGHDDHGHGGIEDGLNIRGAEVVLSATVDQLFDAYANLAFATGGVEVEEAYFTTRALPAGWQVKGGKFLSGFGYANGKHPHAWDFTDQNLAYLSLVGDHGLNDTGLQATWSPATDTWMQVGVEVLQGHAQEKFGGAGIDLHEIEEAIADAAGTLNPPVAPLPTVDGGDFPAIDRRGPQLYTGFLRVAPDLGTDHALQLGLSYATHRSHQEAHEELDPADNVEAVFYAEGDATLLGLEAVYKRAATGRQGKGALRVNAEYLLLDKDLSIVYHTDPAETGEPLTGEQDALYVQATYGFAPRWQAGLRYDATGIGTNEVAEGGATDTLADSARVSAALTFRPSEFSYWRLQVANADITDADGVNESFTQVMLQYNLSLGAHGAHAF